MKLKNIKLNKSSQYKRRNIVGFHFCEVPKTGKGKETEGRMVVAGGLGVAARGWLPGPGGGCQQLGAVKGSRGCSLMGTGGKMKQFWR